MIEPAHKMPLWEPPAGVIAVGALAAGVIAWGALALARLWAMGAYARALYYVDAYGESPVVPAWMRSLTGNLSAAVIAFVAVLGVLGLALSLMPLVALQLRALRNRGLGIR